MKNQEIKFKNGFGAIFSGVILKTYSSGSITHHEMGSVKLIEKSDINFKGANSYTSKTLLNSHIL